MNTTFEKGILVTTSAVLDRMAEDGRFAAFVNDCLARYNRMDWGDLDEEDASCNDAAVSGNDDGILASYEREGFADDKIWIKTEWDRSVTTVLFPCEY